MSSLGLCNTEFDWIWIGNICMYAVNKDWSVFSLLIHNQNLSKYLTNQSQKYGEQSWNWMSGLNKFSDKGNFEQKPQ